VPGRPATLALATLALAAGIAGPAPRRPEPPSIVGRWVVETETTNGHVRPAPVSWLEFTADGKVCLSKDEPDGPLLPAGTYTTAPAKDPAEVDLSLNLPGGRGTLAAIYFVDRERLTLCIQGNPGQKRPTEFAAPADSGITLWRCKRADKKK
jgi:uncharacterized protein (TIGR03067 family)